MSIFLNEIGKDWFLYFGFVLLQNTLFLGLLFLLLTLLKNVSARVKHIVMAVGLVKLVVPPFIPIFILGNETTPQLAQKGSIVSNTQTGTVVTNLSLNVETILFLGWVIIGFGFALFFVFSIFKLRIQLRSSKELKTNNFKALEALKIKLFQSEKISMPISCGYFSKKIYVPQIWDEWNPECQQFIIEHEIAHLRRHDNWILLLQIVTKVIYFFHPLVWYLNRRLDELREMACDDYIIKSDETYTIRYSKYLVEIAENTLQRQSGYFPASAIIKQKNELLNRVKYLMEGKMNQLTKSRFFLVILLLTVSTLTLSLYCSKKGTEVTTSNNETDSNQLNTTSEKPIPMAKLRGMVTEDGKPVAGVRVTILGTSMKTMTDNDGNYVIQDIPPGIYTVSAEKDNAHTITINNIRMSVKLTTTQDFIFKKVNQPE